MRGFAEEAKGGFSKHVMRGVAADYERFARTIEQRPNRFPSTPAIVPAEVRLYRPRKDSTGAAQPRRISELAIPTFLKRGPATADDGVLASQWKLITRAPLRSWIADRTPSMRSRRASLRSRKRCSGRLRHEGWTARSHSTRCSAVPTGRYFPLIVGRAGRQKFWNIWLIGVIRPPDRSIRFRALQP
jgi:hypothetical protein